MVIWSKKGWSVNDLDLEWDMKSGSPTIRNLEKWSPFCQNTFEIQTKTSSFRMVQFSNGPMSSTAQLGVKARSLAQREK